MLDLSGTTVKGYDLQERIGTGGFGAVYRAYQSTVGREVAVKIILPSLANQPEFVRRFETEAQLVARLEHLHIVPLHDYWRDPEGAYLVMRYLRGGSLRDSLSQGPLNLETVARILDQIASALLAAHRNQIIHRDIKPANILLDEDGNAYLADFGIAKNTAISEEGLTEADSLIGSPDYLAPEQARNEAVTPQTDIYSLAVVIYEMLTGEHPFPNQSIIDRLYAHLNTPLPEITTLDASVSKEINEVVQKASAKDPVKRFSDVMKLVAAFREAAALGVSQIEDRLVALLTPREQEVLKLIIEGKTNREIANKLTLELSTVKSYISQIYRKLNVRSRVQAIVKARELNLIVEDFGLEPPVSTYSQLPPPKNPYKGLRAFTVADEKDFFGRERIVKKLIEKLGQKGDYTRFLAVVGPSGSGKSSLVKAGLIPALWRGELEGSDRWYIVDMVPGNHPLDELEVALMGIAADQSLNLAEQLTRDERGLVRAAGILLPEDGSELLLVIDQFEELFTQVENEEEREQFLNLLTAAVLERRSKVRVVVTLRADFYDRPLHYPKFGEIMQNRMETILPLGARELERAIVEPARQVGVDFEDGLIASIVSEINYQPGALPLLQYALTEMFELLENRVMTNAAFEQIGGATGALGRRAEEIFNEFDEVGQEAARQMFLRLVNLGEGVDHTRRRVDYSELIAMAAEPDVMDEAIDTFAAYRLLSLDIDSDTRTPIVEVAHEALLREWKRFGNWFDESLNDIRLQRQLDRSASEWQSSAEDPSFLLRGTKLAQFEVWYQETGLALTGLERRYLESSLALRAEEQEKEVTRQARETRLQQRARRVLQWLVVVLAVGVVASLGFAWTAQTARQDAEEESQGRATQQSIAVAEAEARAEAEQQALEERDNALAAEQAALDAEHQALLQAAIGLAGQAKSEMLGRVPQRAVPLALEALQNYPYTWQAQRALGQAIINHKLEMVLEVNSWVNNIQLSQDGTRLLVGARNGTVSIWDTTSGLELMVLSEHEPTFAVWSPDESLILTMNDERLEFQMWNAAAGEILYAIPVESKIAQTFYNDWEAWTPDGSKLVLGLGDGTATIWDAITGEEVSTLVGHEGAIMDVAWSPGGNRIVTTSADGTAILWDADSGESLVVLPGTEYGIRFGTWSPSGDRFALRGFRRVSVYDAESGDTIHDLETPHWNQPGIRFSPDGTKIISPGFAYTFPRLWDVETGELLLILPGVQSVSAEWSPVGRYIAFPTMGQVEIWDVETGTIAMSLKTPEENLQVEWSPDGEKIYLKGRSGDVRIYDLWPALLTISGDSGPAVGPAWSPDGSQISSIKADGTVTIWRADTGEEVMTLQSVAVDRSHSVAWSPSGDKIMVTYASSDAGKDGIQIFDAASGEMLIHTNLDAPGILTSQWSPDGTRVVSANWTNEVSTYHNGGAYVWDPLTGEVLWSVDFSNCFYATWSPDGTQIAASSAYGQVLILNSASGEVLRQLFAEETGEWISAPLWSSEGERIAIYGAEYISIYDVNSGELLQRFQGGYQAGEWLSEGYLVLGDTEGSVHIYDVEKGVEIMEYEIGGFVLPAISPDHTQMIVASDNGSLYLFDLWLTPEELIAEANDCCMVHMLTPDEREIFGLPPLEE